MSSRDITTITVQPETRDWLWEHKRGPDETMDDALQRVLKRVSARSSQE